jgi:hypothetical protein
MALASSQVHTLSIRRKSVAARLRPKIIEEVRAKIQTVQLINFVQTFALTGKDTGGHDVNPARVQAAKILLDKTVASLQSTELTGDPAKPLATKAVVEFVNASPTAKET